jgi:hypothetical protein
MLNALDMGAKSVKTESTGMDTARLMKAKQAQEFF